MNRFRRFISLMLACLLVSVFITVPASAVAVPAITVSSVEGAAGKTVDIDIALENNPGLICAMLTVDFDSTALELVAVRDTGLLPGQLHTPDLSSPYTLTWMNNTVLKDYTVVGTIVTLQFRISQSASAGDIYSINVSYDYDNYEIYNFDFEPLEFAIKNGLVTVGCAHENTTVIPETPADCEKSGYSEGVYCSDCDKYISGHEVIPSTGVHIDADGDWESDEVNHFHTCAYGHVFDISAHSGSAADCTEDGVCTVCGKVIEEKLGHFYKAVVTKPACEEKGYTTHTCSRCGDHYVDSYVDASGHKPGAEATCTKDQTCTVCGKVIKEKLGHDYTTVVTKPTCEEKGYTTHTCSRCGDSYVDSYVDASGHTAGEWIIVKEPAIGVEGLKEKHCTVCGKTIESEVIPALKPEFVKGDVNGNGDVDAQDYALAKRYVLGTYTLTEEQIMRGDINGNGELEAGEYALIKRHVLGTYTIK